MSDDPRLNLPDVPLRTTIRPTPKRKDPGGTPTPTRRPPTKLKAVPAPAPTAGFDAGKAFGNAGFHRHVARRASSEARAVGGIGLRTGRRVSRAAARGGFDLTGGGGAIVAAAASLLGLLLLDLVLSPKGASALAKVFDFAGRGVKALANPTNTLLAASPPAVDPSIVMTTDGRSYKRTTGPDGRPYLVPLDPNQGTKQPEASYTPARPTGRLAAVPGTAQRIDSAFLPQVVSIEKQFGVTVSSGYRDPAHNAEVGGAPNSDHLSGYAADFTGSAAAISRLYAWARGAGFAYVEPLTQSRDHVHVSFFRPGTPTAAATVATATV